MKTKRKNIAQKQWIYIAEMILFILLGITMKPHCATAADYVKMDGTFKINTKLKAGMMLDIAGNSSQNGANIQIYQDNESTAQQFKITHIGSGWHTICNTVSGKSLDVTGAVAKNGINVQLYKANNTDAQKWRFISAGNGYYYIQSKLGFYLDVAGGISANETNVCIYSKNDTNAQKWKIEKIIFPKKINLNTASISLTSIGAAKKLTASILPSNATLKKITWSSSNNNVATVSNDGTVRATGSGDAIITAKTSNGFTVSAKVNVNDGCKEIAEGLYSINSKVSANAMLDVNGKGTANGTNIQIYKNNGSVAQKFYIKNMKYGWYVIYNAFPQQCLDVKNGLKDRGTNVHLYKYNGSDAQKWRFFSAGNGYYYAMNKLGCYLDVCGGSSKNSTNVQTWTKNDSDAQKWKLSKTKSDYVNVADGFYNINTKLMNSLVLDVTGNETANGTNIQTYNNNNTIAQKFRIQCVSDGWYRIVNPFSEKSLDVQNGSKQSGANVQLYDSNNSNAQKWRFILSGDGQYLTIKNKLGNCLDVYAANKQSGTNVQVWGANNTDAQKWKLIETSFVELTGIKINTASVTLNIGQTKQLGVTYEPSNATAANTKVNWDTDNPKVATVSDGTVKAVGAGSAIITATSHNGKTASVAVTVNSAEKVYTTREIQITSNGQTVDTFNGVSAQYIMGIGNSNTGKYCCANYVDKYYRAVFGISVWNMFTGRTPTASSGSFRVISSPKAGDVGYQLNGSNSGHWFIIKTVNGDGTYTIIEQNWKWKKGNGTYCNVNRKVSYSKTKGLKFFRWVR